ncbi:hypothetical protein NDU88_001648 [Pleurodeles waltl]|uniref:Uncharacterized protein n=1 Tax=Pleurodeles waltl TaxID=8319 RepID=A0AAV7M5W5_PLEWA|nr:hypothetical protein NDU88_001648 [Pleurodeles waltl]
MFTGVGGTLLEESVPKAESSIRSPVMESSAMESSIPNILLKPVVVIAPPKKAGAVGKRKRQEIRSKSKRPRVISMQFPNVKAKAKDKMEIMLDPFCASLIAALDSRLGQI